MTPLGKAFPGGVVTCRNPLSGGESFSSPVSLCPFPPTGGVDTFEFTGMFLKKNEYSKQYQ